MFSAQPTARQEQAPHGTPEAEHPDTIETRLWLEDWDTYLTDRVEFAEALTAGEDAELLITARGAAQITVTLDHFAMVNDMLACSTPLDA